MSSSLLMLGSLRNLRSPEITGFGESPMDGVPPLSVAEFVTVAEFVRIRGFPELSRVRLHLFFHNPVFFRTGVVMRPFAPLGVCASAGDRHWCGRARISPRTPPTSLPRLWTWYPGQSASVSTTPRIPPQTV